MFLSRALCFVVAAVFPASTLPSHANVVQVASGGWCNAGFLDQKRLGGRGSLADYAADCQSFCMSRETCKYASYMARGKDRDGLCMVYSSCDPTAMAGDSSSYASRFDTWVLGHTETWKVVHAAGVDKYADMGAGNPSGSLPGDLMLDGVDVGGGWVAYKSVFIKKQYLQKQAPALPDGWKREWSFDDDQWTYKVPEAWLKLTDAFKDVLASPLTFHYLTQTQPAIKVASRGWCNAGFLDQKRLGRRSSLADCKSFCMSRKTCKYASYMARGKSSRRFCMVYSSCDPTSMAEGDSSSYASRFDTWVLGHVETWKVVHAAGEKNVYAFMGAGGGVGFLPVGSSFGGIDVGGGWVAFKSGTFIEKQYLQKQAPALPDGWKKTEWSFADDQWTYKAPEAFLKLKGAFKDGERVSLNGGHGSVVSILRLSDSDVKDVKVKFDGDTLAKWVGVDNVQKLVRTDGARRLSGTHGGQTVMV